MAVPADLEGGNGQAVVVVVDDDPGYLKAMVLTIERSDLDVEVVEAATGVDALLEIGRVQPSLIVLDYSLPDLNAPQVIQRLLEPGRRLDAEVMVVTGGMPDEAAVGLRQMGVKLNVAFPCCAFYGTRQLVADRLRGPFPSSRAEDDLR